jgi:hypothetical protein
MEATMPFWSIVKKSTAAALLVDMATLAADGDKYAELQSGLAVTCNMDPRLTPYQMDDRASSRWPMEPAT